MEKQQNAMLVSLDSLPQDILDQLKDYRFIQEEKKEDSEVEDCFRNDLPTTPRSKVSGSPGTPRSKYSDDLVFKYPPQIQNIEDNHGKGNRSPRRLLDRLSQSLHSENEHCHLFGDTSDWMMAERLKPRTPPVSPDTSSRSSTCSSSFIEPQRHLVLTRSPESCFVRPPSSPRMDNYLQSPRLERTPQKRCFSPRNRIEHQQELLERTPLKIPIVPEPQLPQRSITGSSHKTELNSDQLSPGFYVREMVNRSPSVRDPENIRRIPDFAADYVDERRAVRKQLVFEGQPQRNDDIYNHRKQYSPRFTSQSSSSSPPRFEYGDTDDLAERLRDPESTALLSQILTQLTKRKRKTSERSECDCDCEDRSAKKRRNDLKYQMKLNYLKQLETDVSVLNNQLRRSELEARPENCSCAIMERQFLQMAENAYKNIRRHDTSADGFAQFRKELTETNSILKESLTVLNNMKAFCEHKSIIGLS